MFRFTLIAAVLAATLSAPASAESRAVRHADLDLSTAEGRATLDRRIDYAARLVCGVGASRELAAAAAANRCYRSALTSTETQLAAVTARRTRAPA